MVRPILLFVTFLLPLPVLAAPCSDYERQVFQLLDEARQFQQTDGAFKRLGFARKGPFSDWLQRMEALRDSPDLSGFYARYGFSPVDVFLIANEYRTEGSLDSFYQGVENDILGVDRCGP